MKKKKKTGSEFIVMDENTISFRSEFITIRNLKKAFGIFWVKRRKTEHFKEIRNFFGGWVNFMTYCRKEIQLLTEEVFVPLLEQEVPGHVDEEELDFFILSGVFYYFFKKMHTKTGAVNVVFQKKVRDFFKMQKPLTGIELLEKRKQKENSGEKQCEKQDDFLS